MTESAEAMLLLQRQQDEHEEEEGEEEEETPPEHSAAAGAESHADTPDVDNNRPKELHDAAPATLTSMRPAMLEVEDTAPPTNAVCSSSFRQEA